MLVCRNSITNACRYLFRFLQRPNINQCFFWNAKISLYFKFSIKRSFIALTCDCSWTRSNSNEAACLLLHFTLRVHFESLHTHTHTHTHTPFVRPFVFCQLSSSSNLCFMSCIRVWENLHTYLPDIDNNLGTCVWERERVWECAITGKLM